MSSSVAIRLPPPAKAMLRASARPARSGLPIPFFELTAVPIRAKRQPKSIQKATTLSLGMAKDGFAMIEAGAETRAANSNGTPPFRAILVSIGVTP